MCKIAQRAYELHSAFETKQRDNGESFVTLKRDAPEWMTKVIYNAHDGEMPNDWIFNSVFEAAFFIQDLDQLEDGDASMFAEQQTQIYGADLMKWATDNIELVDETVHNVGFPDGGIITATQMAQHDRLCDIYEFVKTALNDV